MKQTCNIGLHLDNWELICFKLGVMPDMIKTLELYSSLNDLDLHSRSQDYGKARICVVSLL